MNVSANQFWSGIACVNSVTSATSGDSIWGLIWLGLAAFFLFAPKFTQKQGVRDGE